MQQKDNLIKYFSRAIFLLLAATTLINLLIGNKPLFPFFPLGAACILIVGALAVITFRVIKLQRLTVLSFRSITILCGLLLIYVLSEGALQIYRGGNLYFLKAIPSTAFILLYWLSIKFELWIKD